MAANWDTSAEDFGQKVDLTVRIREILRNYPEGLSIVKELIQNADDAGARTVRFCVAEQRNGSNNAVQNDALSGIMKGPSLLAYNSAKFTDVDFKSIQRIGDSLKKDAKGTKTGRFGVGVNSTYHLTDVPMFVSGTKIVMFDPQASYVPGINPANPGKMVDCSKENGRTLVQSLPQVFDPLKVFGCKLQGEDFNGTIFRFALRTDEQAEVSRLSRQSHPIEKIKALLSQMASVASSMLLFLKNVECIEIYEWSAKDAQPKKIHSTSISNITENIRTRRSYVLNAPSRVPSKPVAVDYILDMQSNGIGVVENGGKAFTSERWMVCNQLGGGNASVMASNSELSHMKLVPWAGVAARLSPPCDVISGNAYCFLPLPVQTNLPIHVNGYFELSSNRRDVWSGSDMAGDGKARAEWNDSIVKHIAAPSYIRLVASAIRTNSVTSNTYELLFPQKTLSGPWELLCREFMIGIRNLPVLYSNCMEQNKWVSPAQCILPHKDDDQDMIEILSLDRLPLVILQRKDLKEKLLKYETCRTTATPGKIRKYFSVRKSIKDGSLESKEQKIKFAQYLLAYCLSDLGPTQYSQLSGCQLIPLANGELAKFSVLRSYDSSFLTQLRSMGFSKLLCAHSLRINDNNVDLAMEWLLKYRYEDDAVKVQAGIDPFLICSSESTSILKFNASDTFVDLDCVEDPKLKRFFTSGAASSQLNILLLQSDMLADVVARSIPRSWRGNDSAQWNPDMDWPNVKWFVDLWRFICSDDKSGESLSAVSEQYCIVPTQQGLVCALSPGASVIDSNGLDQSIAKVLVHLGVRIFYADVFPKDLVIPKAIWSYVFQPTTDGIIKVIDAAIRRESSSSKGMNMLSKADDGIKLKLFEFFARKGATDISTQGRIMLQNLPIFPMYSNSNSNNMDAKFGSMIKAGDWHILEGATDDDGKLMTSDFLMTKNHDEFQFVKSLGVRIMSRKDFFTKVIVPQLGTISKDLRNNVMGTLLLNLPSLAANNPGFSDIISKTKCITSAETKTLKSPIELYDPGVSQLVALMSNDSFPDDYFINPDILLSLRQLGLQSSLTWDVVLQCARSIEVEGSRNDTESAVLAKSRGSELLIFLDMHKETYFPQLNKKSSKSRTGMLFRKMNAAIFQDAEEKKRDKQLHAERVTELLNVKWVPIFTEPPSPYLPWPETCESVAAPVDTILMDKMWLASYSKRIVDGDMHSNELRKMFGWLNDISIKDISLQLRMLSSTFESLRLAIESDNEGNESITMNSLCQTVSAEVGRLYHILNSIESDYEIDVMKSVLHGSDWLWMGNAFVSSDHVAFTSSINATPYLHTVPPDVACFKNLLGYFNVRVKFGSSDYCHVLSRMAENQSNETKLSEDEIELAVTLVQKISDDILRLRDFEIYAPTLTGQMIIACKLVYDDAPWLSKDLGGKKELTYAHPKLSASVCDKIGVQSVRNVLLQSSADMIKFGDTVVHESFGQSESLTRRLKNIVEMYPEGPQQLSELIQNADDAKATVVKFLISKKKHGKSSLLGQKMTEWQGSGLYCYNDATFTARDFQNLSKIGQASKLQKLVTTGRFGLGFNSVFHWTDVPSLVSGDYLVMFDPHAKYVPGATDAARGIKIRFSNTELVNNFPHQMSTYLKFGCNMTDRFEGTLFRFPFRNAETAAESEISRKQYGDEQSIDELLSNFKKVVSKVILFLRHVKRVEVHLEENDDNGPKLLYFAEVASRKAVESPPLSQVTPAQASGFDGLRSIAANTFAMLNQSNDWNAIADFISGPESNSLSKEAFYIKLLRTPENQLPQTKHVVTINFVDNTCILESDEEVKFPKPKMISDEYLICSALGAGKCRVMACNPQHIDLKFLPWAGIAAHLRRNGDSAPDIGGNAFCFLPLPAETGFSLHLNGYFELSANRRDIWFGDDMSGSGKLRSEWNRLLLSDVISPLYTQVLLTARSLIGPGRNFDRLWPVNVSSEIWKIVRSHVYSLAMNLPLAYSMIDSGKWCPLSKVVFLESPDNENIDRQPTTKSSNSNNMLMSILLLEKISVVSIRPAVISCMEDEKCGIVKVSPAMVRDWFRRPNNHPSLHERDNVVFLLRYCSGDLVETQQFRKLSGLPLLPLLNGLNGIIHADDSKTCYFVPSEIEKDILTNSSFALVDTMTSDLRLNSQLRSEMFLAQTNVKMLDMPNFVKLLHHSYPSEWIGLPEIRWTSHTSSNEDSPENIAWLTKLWEYILTDREKAKRNLEYFENGLQIIPSFVGEGEKTLQTLHNQMAVVDITESNNPAVSKILWCIGIRTLDTAIFIKNSGRSSLLHGYIHPPTIHGILQALANSLPDISIDEKNERMAARFQYLNKTQKIQFRKFLRDAIAMDLTKEEILTLRSLPIFEVFALGQTEQFSHLHEGSFLPPSCAERNHLNDHFVKTTSLKDVQFLESLGLKTMNSVDYYASYLCASLSNNLITEENRLFAVTKMLQDIPALVEEDSGKDLASHVSNVAFVLNSKYEMVKPCELYDPHEPGLIDLVDDSMLPAKELRQSSLLQTLRSLGMKTKLNIDGILESAKRIEYEAKNLSIQADVDDEHICVIRKRATSLLNFLDDDNTVAQFLDELSEQNYASKPHGETNEIELTCIENSCDVIDELKSICWLPVEYELSSDNGPEARPPRRQHQLSMIGISSPVATRPKADEWICSKSTDILSLTLKSEALVELLEWNNPPNMNNVAAQIVALSQLSSEETNFHSLRHHLPTVTSQIYEILDSQIAFAKEENLNQLKSMLSNNPWIWVGDSFVSTNQVAFNAPDNARPFLYTVPDAMKSFESLLHLCGVRNTFSGSDFVHLLSSLANQLNSSICDSRQLDLAIFVSRYLSRISSEELETLDKAQIYLPSQNMVMYRASEMTFDDAPWLSAIVKRTKHVFVHPDIGNEVARTLGSKSLRDVLSANQNGMVKVPCPKHDAIRQLLFQRKSDSNEILKVVYELIELAEMKTAKQVSVALDYRTHSTMSLLHPCLAAAQGPALIVCFHDIAVEVDEIVKLTSPAHYYSNSISGNGGGGGSGFPRFGRGLCGCFSLTDCLQVLTGRSLLIFDPNGEYFIEDRNPIGDNGEQKVNQVPNDRMKKKEKASARNYGISHPFCEQFPDQFEPFLSLPYGVAESMMSSRSSKTGAYFRGTVIRIPLRNEGSPSSLIYDRIYDDEDLKTLEEELKEKLSQTLLFTYNLQSVNLDKWQVGESNCENTLNSRVGSSPLTRREHLEEMWDNKLWKKEKSSFGKVGKLFKSSWIPLRTNYALQISSRRAGEDTDITDTYTIMSILAPPRLREMACTESLSPLKLLPMVSIAAHLHRNHATPQLNTRNFEPAEGHVFVGLPTGIKTGLPFHINAPLFLHEWTGDIILGKEDDIEFQKAFPGIRNVTIFDKQQKNPQTRSLALYVWNQQAIMSSLAQLIPPMMKEIKTNIQLVVDDHKLFYRFWPYYNRIKPRFRNFVNASIYEQLANPDMDIYLTENDGFKCVGDGCFTSSEYKLNDASDFFLNKMALFTTPKLVVEDLNRFGLDGRQLTPSVARKLLRGGQHVRELTGRPREVLAILEYCLADIISATDFQSVSQAASLCRKELLGLYILPLSDGSIGKIGTKVIIANAQEQSMLPNMKKNFLWSRAIKSMEVLLRKEDFVTLCSFEHFGPKVLSQNISTILPPSWEGKDFVKWDIDRDDSSGPDKIWIQQFWRVVPIWDHDAVQLFRRWPLIPTKHGELASCGNARFILYVCNAAIDESIRSSLAENIASLRDDLDTMEKRDLMSLTAERRQNNNASTTLHNEEFWEMGKIEDDEVLVSSDSTRGLETTSDNSNSTNTASDSNAILENDRSESDGFHDDIEDDTNDAQTQDIMDNQETHYVQPYDPNTSCFRSLYEILLSIHCPLIEASFFTNEELDKILPGDRLGVTRAITGTLNQSMNYWTSVNDQRNERLHWTSLNTSQLDELLLFLSSHQGNRLSLMVSDLTTMKNLPLFETFNGTHIAISDRDHNFTLNSEADIDSLRSYLPLSLQRKLLLDKPQFKALYDDLNIRDLDEAAILQQFVLQEFDSMSISQKEIVIKNIIEKWDILKESDDFITTLKETAFVKKKGNENNGDISFVKANQLFDTRNELLNLVFDKDRSCFPAEEFTSNNALDMLVAVGLNTKIDKDTFMKCAWIVEGEQSVPKALKLFEYFNDNFGDFYDNNRGEFLRQLAEVCCVPAADGQSLGLCRFRDAAAPKDKHLVFRVMPIIHNSAIPPQVMHSSLGIISPPPISVVLRQLRSLIEDESLLDRWNYKHGSIETVFSEIFSFLQDNYADLSPRVEEGLKERPIVPIGTTLVKVNRLFFRLAKDLSPFFYEVPRSFGAYDVLLRNLGVRETPKSDDYALSLLELNREIGESKLNANELKSVIEVVSLASANDQSAVEEICAPNLNGNLVNIKDLLKNDQPWLVNSQRLDLKKINICHPKMNDELIRKLGIQSLSQQVHEVLDDQFTLNTTLDTDEVMKALEQKIKSQDFLSALLNLLPSKERNRLVHDLKIISLVKVQDIKTRFVIVRNNGDRNVAFDVTDPSNNSSTLCFINKNRILLANLPLGVSPELAVATALCNKFCIPRQHIGGINALLSTSSSNMIDLQQRMGLFGDRYQDELLRGEAGQPLVSIDKELAVLKPLKVFKKGEIVAVGSQQDPSQLVYGVVKEALDSSSISRLTVTIGRGIHKSYLTSEVYSLGRSNIGETKTSLSVDEVDMSCLELTHNHEDENGEYEDALVNQNRKSSLEPVKRKEILSAVQDLLQSADLSLNDNAKNMLDSNLSLQETLTQKEKQIESIEKKTYDIAKKAMTSVDSFLCPITRELMTDPAICCDGHTYERSAIELWLRNNARSPKTNQPLASRELIPNHALRSAIDAMSALRASLHIAIPDLEEEE